MKSLCPKLEVFYIEAQCTLIKFTIIILIETISIIQSLQKLLNLYSIVRHSLSMRFNLLLFMNKNDKEKLLTHAVIHLCIYVKNYYLILANRFDKTISLKPHQNLTNFTHITAVIIAFKKV